MTAHDAKVRALAARIVVLDAYDLARRLGYLDLGGSRRRSATERLDRDLYRLDPTFDPATLTGDEVAAAFEREGRRLLRGATRNSAASVRNALRRTTVGLESRGTIDDVVKLYDVLERLGVEGHQLERVNRRTGRGQVVA